MHKSIAASESSLLVLGPPIKGTAAAECLSVIRLTADTSVDSRIYMLKQAWHLPPGDCISYSTVRQLTPVASSKQASALVMASVLPEVRATDASSHLRQVMALATYPPCQQSSWYNCCGTTVTAYNSKYRCIMQVADPRQHLHTLPVHMTKCIVHKQCPMLAATRTPYMFVLSGAVVTNCSLYCTTHLPEIESTQNSITLPNVIWPAATIPHICIQLSSHLCLITYFDPQVFAHS